MTELVDQTALVTNVGSPLGLELALALSNAGARLVLQDSNADK